MATRNEDDQNCQDGAEEAGQSVRDNMSVEEMMREVIRLTEENKRISDSHEKLKIQAAEDKKEADKVIVQLQKNLKLEQKYREEQKDIIGHLKETLAVLQTQLVEIEIQLKEELKNKAEARDSNIVNMGNGNGADEVALQFNDPSLHDNIMRFLDRVPTFKKVVFIIGGTVITVVSVFALVFTAIGSAILKAILGAAALLGRGIAAATGAILRIREAPMSS